jgi:hypothetical protein
MDGRIDFGTFVRLTVPSTNRSRSYTCVNPDVDPSPRTHCSVILQPHFRSGWAPIRTRHEHRRPNGVVVVYRGAYEPHVSARNHCRYAYECCYNAVWPTASRQTTATHGPCAVVTACHNVRANYPHMHSTLAISGTVCCASATTCCTRSAPVASSSSCVQVLRSFFGKSASKCGSDNASAL